jgi:hypothetical protein
MMLVIPSKAAALLACAALCASATASGQTVYKCKANGTVVYSHEPCLGAEVVDTTPTQGLDKSSGMSRKGVDVRRSEHNKMMAEALRPILGETQVQYETRLRRSKLLREQRLECAVLDRQLARHQRTEDTGVGKSSDGGAAALLELQKQFRELRC